MTGIGINLREVPDDNGGVKLKVLGLILDGPAHAAGVRQVVKKPKLSTQNAIFIGFLPLYCLAAILFFFYTHGRGDLHVLNFLYMS